MTNDSEIPQPQEVANVGPSARPRRLLWPLRVAAFLVPAILFLVYDIVLPTLELQRIRKVVAEEVKRGDNWEEAAKRLKSRGEITIPPPQIGRSTVYFVHSTSRSYSFRMWSRIALYMYRYDLELPWAPTLWSEIYTDGSGAVIDIH